MAKKKSSSSTGGKKPSRRSSERKASDTSSPAGPQPAPTQASEAAVPTETIPHPKPTVDNDHEERLAKNLIRTVIALPLLDKLNHETKQRLADPSRRPILYEVIIDLNLEYPKGREAARDWVFKSVEDLLSRQGPDRAGQRLDRKKSEFNEQYIFASLEGRVIRELVDWDGKEKPDVLGKDGKPRKARAIYQIWEDFKLKAFITSSITTVKADAARVAFTALGDNIVWAVVDSGIQETIGISAHTRTLPVRSRNGITILRVGLTRSRAPWWTAWATVPMWPVSSRERFLPIRRCGRANHIRTFSPIPDRSGPMETRRSEKWCTSRSRRPALPVWPRGASW